MSAVTQEQVRREDELKEQARRDTAEYLVARLLADRPEQMQLFEIDKEQSDAKRYEEGVEMLRVKYPGKLIIDAKRVREYRYEAAMYGAGFHPSQFDEITWQENELAGTNTVYFDVLGGWHVHHQPDRIGRASRMYDEVRDELFNSHVPTTVGEDAFGNSVYITSEEDLRAIFEFDQANLAVCRELDIDLLYEKENI